MSRTNTTNSKSRREKIGFYTALSICLIAVCMAVYSTYSTVSSTGKIAPVSTSETGVAVFEQSPAKVTVPAPTLGSYFVGDNKKDTTEPTTDAQPTTTAAEATASETTKGRADALETMLAADVPKRPRPRQQRGEPTRSKPCLPPTSVCACPPNRGMSCAPTARTASTSRRSTFGSRTPASTLTASSATTFSLC